MTQKDIDTVLSELDQATPLIEALCVHPKVQKLIGIYIGTIMNNPEIKKMQKEQARIIADAFANISTSTKIAA